jgi:methylaspartate mutase epsilon subunit
MNQMEFDKMREEVIRQWPTGREIMHEEAVEYYRSRGDDGLFHKILSQAEKNGRILVQPRCGVPTVEGQIELLNFLKKEGDADLLSLTIDSYTRQNHYADAAKYLKMGNECGKTFLNGNPLVEYGVNGGRKISNSCPVPMEVRHGSPDARLLAEIAIASGFSSFEGGPITYTIPYSKNFDLRTAIEYWRYIDTLTAWYVSKGIIINRESFGPLTGILLPPCIEISISILEALLMADEGVNSITLGHSQTGCLYQDVAAVSVMKKLARKYLNVHGHNDVHLTIAFHQWMGPFPKQECNAFGLISLATISAFLSKCNKIIVKTSHEAIGVPTKEANAASLRLTKFILNNAPASMVCEISSLNEEMEAIENETVSILEAVFNEPALDLADKIVSSFRKGILDVPFAASSHAAGKVILMRDKSGAIRFLDCGRLPFDKRAKKSDVLPDSNIAISETLRDIFYFDNYEKEKQKIFVH